MSKKPTGGQVGRPSRFTKELAVSVCERIACGESLRAIARDIDIPPSTLVGWFVDDVEGVFKHYARARQIQAEGFFEELCDIADDGHNDWMERNGYTVPDQEAIQRSKLRVDTRKWILARMDSNRYAETSKQEHSGAGGAPLQIIINRPGSGEDDGG
jgi:hypothetical protein